MTEHDVVVIYVPVCEVCWRDVELTEADDGTWRHVPRPEPVRPEDV